LIPILFDRHCIYNDYVSIHQGRRIPERAAKTYGLV